MKHSRWFVPLVIVLALTLAPAPLLAQSSGTTSGDLRGRVVDNTGAALPGVTVTATNKQTGSARNAVTKIDGDYVIALLPPGTYTVKAEVNLFNPAVKDDVRVALGSTVTVDLQLVISQNLAAAVEVTAESPIIDQNKTDLSQVIDSTKIEQLPNVARNFLSFSLTTPRVTEDRGPSGGASATSGFSINGQSPRLNNVAVDGFDNNDQATGAVRATFSQDAVQEYQVITNPYAAEFGRTAAGVINIVTKSGTNQFKGSGFYYYRNDSLASADPITGEKIPLKDHRFGLSLGGPLVKDKTFFFVAGERQSTDTANAVSITGADVNLIRSKGFSMECAENASGTLTTANCGNVGYEIRNTAVSLKIDHQFSSSNFLALRGNYSKGEDENASSWGGLTSKSGGGFRDSDDKAGAASLTSIFGASSFNELRALYSTSSTDLGPLDPNLSPMVIIPGVATIGSNRLLPQNRDSKVFQVFDAFSFEADSKGHVRLKAGVEFNSNNTVGALPLQFLALYRFGAFPANALFAGQPALSARAAFAGIPTIPTLAQGIPQVFVQAFGDPNGDQTATQLGAFVQADITVSSSFLLRVGARYDKESPIEPFPSDSNFAPRLSFSWAATDKFRIKGGAGRFYGVGAIGPMFAVNIQNGVTVRTQIRSILGGPSPLTPWNILPSRRFATEAAAGTGVVPLFVLRAGDYKSAQTDQASLGFEMNLGNKLLASVDGVYSRGKNVLQARNVNPQIARTVGTDTVPAVAGPRPDPRFGDIFSYESTGNSWYTGGTLGLQTRLGGPFETSIFYTYAKAEDDYIDWLTEFQAQDPLNPGDERAPSVQSPDQKLTISATYSTVGRQLNAFLRDWSFGAIVDWKNGLHYNITMGGIDRNANGDPLSDRPTGVSRNAGSLGSQFSLDLRLARTIWFGSDVSAEIIAVCTNVTDNENVIKRNDAFYSTPGVQNPTFDQPTQYGPGRLFQLGARFSF